MDASKPETREWCVSCREWVLASGPGIGRNSLFVLIPLYLSPFCRECVQKVLPPPEQRFEELFKAARVLFREGITEEDQIIPTLTLANDIGDAIQTFRAAKGLLSRAREDLESCEPEIDDSVPFRVEPTPDEIENMLSSVENCSREIAGLVREKEQLVRAREDTETWESKATEFIRKYGNLRPVEVVDGILVLERLPVSIEIGRCPSNEIRMEAMIKVYRHPRPAKPEHVATLYEKTISAAGIPFSDACGSISFRFGGGYLLMVVGVDAGTRRHIESSGDPPERDLDLEPLFAFPHPRHVQGFHQMVLEEPSKEGTRYLTSRERGRAPAADNLIPACVAFFLREYGQISGRKRIHQLLNKHVLCERTWKRRLPEDGYSSSETNQLWRDVGKVRHQLISTEHRLLSLEWPSTFPNDFTTHFS